MLMAFVIRTICGMCSRPGLYRLITGALGAFRRCESVFHFSLSVGVHCCLTSRYVQRDVLLEERLLLAGPKPIIGRCNAISECAHNRRSTDRSRVRLLKTRGFPRSVHTASIHATQATLRRLKKSLSVLTFATKKLCFVTNMKKEDCIAIHHRCNCNTGRPVLRKPL